MASRPTPGRVAIVGVVVLAALGVVASPVASTPATDATGPSPASSASDAAAPASPSAPNYADRPVDPAGRTTGESPFGRSESQPHQRQFGQETTHAPFGESAATDSFARNTGKETPEFATDKASYDPTADHANETDSS